MSDARRQIAFTLPEPDHARLKRLSAALGVPYSVIVAEALQRLEQSAASGPASETTSRTLVIYARLAESDRSAWETRVRELRQLGGSYAAISKRLYREHGLAGADGLPLSPGTIRSICAM